MRISERIRRANGEKPDFAIDDIGDIGHWQGMNDAALIAEAEELVQLTDDQQVVLDWLKNASVESSPFFSVWRSVQMNNLFPKDGMSIKQQFQILQAFAEWGLTQEVNDD